MADKKVCKEEDKIDFLDEDTVQVTGQHYCLLSYLSPDKVDGQPKNTGKVAIKIRGSFDNVDQAKHHCKKLMKADPSVNTYIVDMYRWLLLPADDDAIGETVYGEDFLQSLFAGYKHSKEVAKEAFKKRTNDIKRDGLDKHLLPEEVTPKSDLKPEDLRVGSSMPIVPNLEQSQD